MFGGRVCTGRVWAVGVDGTVSRRDLSGRAAPIPLSRALRHAALSLHGEGWRACPPGVEPGGGCGERDVMLIMTVIMIIIIIIIAGVSARSRAGLGLSAESTMW